MSAQTIAEAFAPWEAHYKALVYVNTWGHLAPKKNATYYGHIVFAVGIFGSDDLNPTPLACEFKTRKGDDLDSSPWFYDALADFIGDEENRGEPGNVYRFDGTFRNYEFKGKIQLVFRAAAKRGSHDEG